MIKSWKPQRDLNLAPLLNDDVLNELHLIELHVSSKLRIIYAAFTNPFNRKQNRCYKSCPPR